MNPTLFAGLNMSNATFFLFLVFPIIRVLFYVAVAILGLWAIRRMCTKAHNQDAEPTP